MSFILLGILNSQAEAAGGAGAYDLLETQVLSSSASSVTFTGLGSYSDYKHLQIRMVGRGTHSGGNIDLKMTFNGASSGYGYTHKLLGDGSSVSSSANSNSTFFYLDEMAAATSTANLFTPWVIDILDFGSTNKNTTFRALKGLSASNQIQLTSGLFPTTAAVTSVEFAPAAANLEVGSRFSLYGIKG